jgi:hypothetical protein
VALPIFQPIIQAIWAENIAPKAPLSGPSPEAKRSLVDIPIDYMTGDRIGAGQRNAGQGNQLFQGFFAPERPAPNPAQGFIEHFRREPDGQVADTQYQLVSRDDAYATQNQDNGDQGFFGGWNNNGQWGRRSYYPNQGWQPAPQPPPPPQPVARGFFQPWSNQAPSRPSQDFFWGGRVN